MEQLRLHLPAPLSVVTPSTFPWTPPSPSSKAHRAAAPSFPVDPWCWEFFPHCWNLLQPSHAQVPAMADLLSSSLFPAAARQRRDNDFHGRQQQLVHLCPLPAMVPPAPSSSTR
ncbi:hypothetical protein Zm00014a_038922 [Zea mays]|uniref:Uncharacterized protein n=1 Tax=Zea mays TaxID=4577 RepID=A0A3L6F5L4_MAIZE|nr:hypothetical protein Zm00014a_038922 [Zea mays]